MRLLMPVLLSTLFISLALASDLLYRLEELGLDKFSRMIADYNPTIIEEIRKRNDITIWAPGNAAVASHLAATRKRDDPNARKGAEVSCQTTATGSDEWNDRPQKRQLRERPPGHPDKNFETMVTFLNDTAFVNLGPGQSVMFVRSYDSHPDGGVDSPSDEVVTGLGNIQRSIRGPFPFTNGVIYEVDNFFTLPQLFTPTMRKVGIADKFYNKVVSSGKLPLFEETPAVTIFAPIDTLAFEGCSNKNAQPEAHIITGLYFSGQLQPGESVFAQSGAEIKVSRAKNGERLVNCRRLVEANVPTKNGVIHFIDGPLYGDDSCQRGHSLLPGVVTDKVGCEILRIPV